MRQLLVLVVVLAAACGDNDDGLDPVPATLTAGWISIEPATMTLDIERRLSQPGFLSIGTVDEIDETQYYDPRGDARVTLAPAGRPRGMDGAWLVLDDGVRLALKPCGGDDRCAILDVDASAVPRAVQLQLALPSMGGPLYGTGDAAVRANVFGTVREMQLRVDPMSDSSLNETHVPVPLVLWPRQRIGMLVADDRPGALDLGKTNPSTVSATFTLPARGAYRVYLYTTDYPLDLVRRYVALTTKPAVPPRWAFAPQQWRNAHNATSELLADMTEMRARHIPGSLMWIDNPWQTAYNTFVIDEDRFAQIDDAIAQLTAHGYKVLFWSTPYVGTGGLTAADRQEGAREGYFVTDDAGTVIDWPWQDGPGALVDFTAPGATEWWRQRIARVVARGAAGFKLDFGEEIVPDIAGTVVPFMLHAGDNATHHNRYAEGYHDAYLGALPPGEQYLITRAGAWGEQHTNPSIWPGDLDSDFSDHGVLVDGKRSVGGLPSAIARGLSLSVSGYPFYGSDIGGFRGFPTTEALLRWAQYASLGTIMQLGGGGKSHNPWDTTLFDAGADAIYKRYADLHMQLNPLLWTLALQAGKDGTPITVPARFRDECDCDDATFFLGDNLVAAPVITPGATTRTVVLPGGIWIDWWTGERVSTDGKMPITVAAPLDTLPLWQRASSIIPMFARHADTLLPATAAGVTSYADRAYGRELRLVYAMLPEPAHVRLHDGAEAFVVGTDVTLTGGSEYDIFTVQVDGRQQTGGGFPNPQGVSLAGVDLPKVATVAALEACAAPGCWHVDTSTKKFQARVFAAMGETKTISVR